MWRGYHQSVTIIRLCLYCGMQYLHPLVLTWISILQVQAYNSHRVSRGMARYANMGHKSGEGPPVISLESRDGGPNESIHQSSLILIGRYIALMIRVITQSDKTIIFLSFIRHCTLSRLVYIYKPAN